jgi:hypothetical protein
VARCAGGAPEEPAAKLAYLQQKAIGPIKSALDAEIKSTFRATDSATLKVRIRMIHIIPLSAGSPGTGTPQK